MIIQENFLLMWWKRNVRRFFIVWLRERMGREKKQKKNRINRKHDGKVKYRGMGVEERGIAKVSAGCEKSTEI